MEEVNFQSESKRQGTLFENQASAYLTSLKFELLGKELVKEIGCEIDQITVAPNREKVYFEFKGSYRGKTPGMKRTDTVKKAIATGFLLQSVGDPTPFYILTSHLPVKGRALTMVQRAIACGAVADVLEFNTTKTQRVLEDRFGR